MEDFGLMHPSELCAYRRRQAGRLKLRHLAVSSPDWSAYMSIVKGATITRRMWYATTEVDGVLVVASARRSWGASKCLHALEGLGLVKVARLPSGRVPQSPVSGRPPIQLAKWTGLVSVGVTAPSGSFCEVACLRLRRGIPIKAIPRLFGPPDYWTEEDRVSSGIVGDRRSYVEEVTDRRAEELRKSKELMNRRGR